MFIRSHARMRRGTAGSTTAGLVVAGLVLLAVGYALGRRGQVESTPAKVTEVQGVPLAAGPAGTDTSDGGSDETWNGENDAAAPTAGHSHGPAETTDAAAAPAGPAPLVFEPPLVDFGIVMPDTDMQATVRISNVTKEPVRILTMKPDCKCTTVQDLSGRIVQPGEVVEITALVDGRPYPGPKSSEIRFAVEDYGIMRLALVSEVSRSVRTVPPHFTVNLKDGEVHLSDTVLVASMTGEPFSILSAGGRAPVYADDFDPSRHEPRRQYRLAWDLSEYDLATCENTAGERMPHYWVVQTDDPDAPVLDIRVRCVECTLPEPPGSRQWGLSLQRAVIGALAPGASAEFTVYLKWRNDISPTDTIRAVASESEQFEAELLGVDRVEDRITCTVKVTPRPDHRGEINGTVRFFGYRGGSQPFHVLGRVDDR